MTTATSVAGLWELTATTPMGQQRCTLNIVLSGDGFTATVSGDFGEIEVPAGTIDGNNLRWEMRIMNPLPVTLQCQTVVEGDALKGTISATGVGSFPLLGTRLADNRDAPRDRAGEK